MFTLDPQSPTPLVNQVVDGVRRMVDGGRLRAGSKVPSIRQFAQSHGVSVYTVVDAYDRLVAQGYLLSRAGAGFFVRGRARDEVPEPRAPEHRFDANWYSRRVFENRGLKHKPGCGWLPDDWLFRDGLRRSLRHLAAQDVAPGGYGEPKGYPPLRHFVQDLLGTREIAAGLDQVLLVQGSSQGLDLAARCLVRAGDKVLVDTPCYANLLQSLRFLGAELIGVPRTPQGWDLAALDRLAETHRPRVLFTQPRLHCPTGASAQLSQLHQVVRLAEKHDLVVVENDIYSELDPLARPSLASLDQLQRVVHIGSFSKTVSPNLRVGYLAASPGLLDDLAQLKVISGLTSAEFSERLALGTVTDGRWPKHVKSLRDRLAAAHDTVTSRLLGLGFELFCEPKAGLFVWARHPRLPDSAALALEAATQGILLGPGHLFDTDDAGPGPWFRFNVAFSLDDTLYEFLARAIARRGS